MKIYRNIADYIAPANGTVVTIGNFDGVHLGHQAIIHQARGLADQLDLELVVFTFDPPPAHLLRPDKAPRRLSTADLKASWFADLQVDSLVIQEPTPEFLHIEPEVFVRRILAEKLKVRHIIEGQTFNFGHRGRGTFETLKAMQSDYVYETHLAPSVQISMDRSIPHIPICSSLIRNLVSENKFREAGKCLGRCFMLPGRVVKGRGEGSRLGFPTINIEPLQPDLLIPSDGVFAGWVRWGDSPEKVYRDDRQYPAAISIGSCETYEDGRWQIEAHVLDYTTDRHQLVGNHILLAFCDKLRDQRKFDSTDDLKDAIAEDCLIVKTLVNECVLKRLQ